MRWRLAVVACWIVFALLGAFSAGRLTGLLSTSLAVPGSGSEHADAILNKHFGDNIEGSFTVVLRVGAHTSARELRLLNQRFEIAARSVPRSHVMALRQLAGIAYGQISSPLNLQEGAAETAGLRRALDRAGLPSAYVTGAPALQHDITPILTADLHRGELIAVLVALVLLVGVLGLSASVLVPFVVAACTTYGAMAVVFGLAHRFLMVLYVPNVVQLIGLGLAVDYSLLIVHRFKEELVDKTVPVELAVARTMATAGRTVMLSGLAVAIGLSALFLIPVPFVRSLGFRALSSRSSRCSPRSPCSRRCCHCSDAPVCGALACCGTDGATASVRDHGRGWRLLCSATGWLCSPARARFWHWRLCRPPGSSSRRARWWRSRRTSSPRRRSLCSAGESGPGCSPRSRSYSIPVARAEPSPPPSTRRRCASPASCSRTLRCSWWPSVPGRLMWTPRAATAAFSSSAGMVSARRRPRTSFTRYEPATCPPRAFPAQCGPI